MQRLRPLIAFLFKKIILVSILCVSLSESIHNIHSNQNHSKELDLTEETILAESTEERQAETTNEERSEESVAFFTYEPNIYLSSKSIRHFLRDVHILSTFKEVASPPPKAIV